MNKKVWSPGFCSPEGKEYRDVYNLNEFCRRHGLSFGGMKSLHYEEIFSYKEWTKLDDDTKRNATKRNSIYSPGFVDREGNEYRDIRDLRIFCKEHGLALGEMQKVHNEKIFHYKGWKKIGVQQKDPRISVNILLDSVMHASVYDLFLFCREFSLSYRNVYAKLFGQFHLSYGYINLDGNIHDPNRKSQVYAFFSPDRTLYRDITNLKEFCQEHDLDYIKMLNVGNRRLDISNGWITADISKKNIYARSNKGKLLYAHFRSPDGTEYRRIGNLEAFCQAHRLNKKAMQAVLYDEKLQYKGWTKLGGLYETVILIEQCAHDSPT